jgi:hypothetical protein
MSRNNRQIHGFLSVIAEMVVDGALLDAESLGDFRDCQPLLPQGLRRRRRGLVVPVWRPA